MRRRSVLLTGMGLVGTTLAGCIAPSDDGSPNESVDRSPRDQDTPADGSPATETKPIADRSEGDLEDRALQAEAEYLTENLEAAHCVDSWTLSSTTGRTPDATVTNRTDERAYVETTHPYSYQAPGIAADDIDVSAVYRLTNDAIQRVEGDDVAPCEDRP